MVMFKRIADYFFPRYQRHFFRDLGYSVNRTRFDEQEAGPEKTTAIISDNKKTDTASPDSPPRKKPKFIRPLLKLILAFSIPILIFMIISKLGVINLIGEKLADASKNLERFVEYDIPNYQGKTIVTLNNNEPFKRPYKVVINTHKINYPPYNFLNHTIYVSANAKKGFEFLKEKLVGDYNLRVTQYDTKGYLAEYYDGKQEFCIFIYN